MTDDQNEWVKRAAITVAVGTVVGLVFSQNIFNSVVAATMLVAIAFGFVWFVHLFR